MSSKITLDSGFCSNCLGRSADVLWSELRFVESKHSQTAEDDIETVPSFNYVGAKDNTSNNMAEEIWNRALRAINLGRDLKIKVYLGESVTCGTVWK